MDDNLVRGVLLVDELKKRFEKLDVQVASIGQFRGTVYVYLKNIEDAEWIKEFLMEDEVDIVKFFKA